MLVYYFLGIVVGLTVYMAVSYTHLNEVDEEFGNFDYLMGADIDFQNEEVREELLRWGKWYIETTDAVSYTHLDVYKRQTKFNTKRMEKYYCIYGT